MEFRGTAAFLAAIIGPIKMHLIGGGLIVLIYSRFELRLIETFQNQLIDLRMG